MSNNKSESVTSRPSQLKHMHTLSNKDKISKQDPRSNDKPSIDIHIAKGLDTLDREGIKNLKKSLMATRNLEDLHKYPSINPVTWKRRSRVTQRKFQNILVVASRRGK